MFPDEEISHAEPEYPTTRWVIVSRIRFTTPAELNDALRTLDRDELHRVAMSLVSDNAGDEVDAWHLTMAIDRALRHSHRARHAAHAAREASQAVQYAAEAHGMTLPDPEVTAVASRRGGACTRTHRRADVERGCSSSS